MDQMTIRKALDLASTGQYLIPEVVDNAIRDYASKQPVLYNVVTHLPWATNTYFIRRRDALPTATWATDGGSLPSATSNTFAKVSKSVAYLYTRGEVTGPMQRAAGSLYNAMALEVEAHQQALVEKLSTDIATATGSSNDITGIINQIDTDDKMNWGSTGTGVVDMSAAALTLAKIDEAIDTARGEVDLIVTSRQVRRRINALLQAQQQFVDRTEVAAGFRVLTYDGLPIVVDLHWETATDILFIRRADAKLLVHQDWQFEELAKTKDSTDFMIKGYFGFSLEGRPVHLKNFTGA
jgi:HK97 family phage major capsid protein